MDNEQKKPWETFAKAKVQEKPAEASSDVPPWERWGGTPADDTPSTEDLIHTEDLASETEKHLSRLSYTPPSSETWGGWGNRVARSATFGVSDVITAKIIQRQLREEAPDLSYDEVLGAVRDGFKEDQSTSAEIVGMLTPGVAVAKGVSKGGRVAMDAMDRAGVLKGALQWLGKDKLSARVFSSMGEGAAAGATFEAVRVGVDELIGSAAGDQINPNEIRDAALGGAVVGALLSPVANEAMRGAQGLMGWVKQSFGTSDEQTIAASKRLLNTLKDVGEDPDTTVMRLRDDAAAFTADNGRPPALFEIISPDRVREIADVNRYYNGLSPRLRDLTEEQINKSVGTLEKAVSGTKPLMDTEVIESTVEDHFSDVMRIHGDQMVDVGDEAFSALSESKGFLAMQAKHNPEARALLRTVDAKENITKLRADTGKLLNSKNLADEAHGIADIRVRIAEILDEQLNASSLAPSELNQLRNMERLNSALAAQMDKAAKSGYAEANLTNMMSTLKSAEKLLADYEKSGFKVSLRAANAMRFNASRAAKNANDMNAQAEAIGVRDAIMPVGTTEVPSYGRVVKLWNRQMTRSEAHASGKQAVRGEVSPENLAVRSEKGRLPNKPRARIAADVRKGIQEGARIDLRKSAQGSQNDAVSTANRIADSAAVQKNLKIAIPDDAEQIVSAAKQTQKTVEGARAAASKMSPSELQEEVSAVRDQVESLVVGNLGGAGKAGLASRYLMRFKVPRKTAEKIIEMLGDPAQLDDALSYVASRGINLSSFVSVLANIMKDAEDKGRGAE